MIGKFYIVLSQSIGSNAASECLLVYCLPSSSYAVLGKNKKNSSNCLLNILPKSPVA